MRPSLNRQSQTLAKEEEQSFMDQTINLNRCVKGDRLRMRNGEELTYSHVDYDVDNSTLGAFRHYVTYDDGGVGTRTDEGLTFHACESYTDVVEILTKRPRGRPRIIHA
jgi:hypothetical protein